MKRKIAVIGSNSFSGSDFIDLLLEDPQNEVIGLSRSPEKSAVFLPYKRHKNPSFRFHQLDLNRDMPKILETMNTFEPEYVVNFAAQSEVAPSWENPGQWFQTNAVALSTLADALREARYLKRYVHISSPEVYGTCRGIDETAPLCPSTPYAASKAAGDLFLFALHKNFDFPLVMIRSTNVYGAHQQLFKIIPRSVIYLRLGKTIELHGGGAAIKSFIHIRDISRGTLAAMEKGRSGEIYHLSPEKGVAVREVVEKICLQMKKPFETAVQHVGERQGQDSVYEINSAKARSEFGWAPQISLETGLQGVVDWVNAHWETIQSQPLTYQHKP